MYRIRLNSIAKNYEFDKNKGTLCKGSLMYITNFAIEEGVNMFELERAYMTMGENDHTVAEFSANGYFLFSK